MDAGERYTVADLSLAESGGLKVAWARSRMPALAALRAQAEKDQPLAGQRVAGCLHVTKETAVLIETIEAAGAEVSWSGCNPRSTQDEVAAWLAAAAQLVELLNLLLLCCGSAGLWLLVVHWLFAGWAGWLAG